MSAVSRACEMGAKYSGPAAAVPETKSVVDSTATDAVQFVLKLPQLDRPIYVGEVTARLRQSVATERPFVERLTQFWTNHFAVSIDKIAVLGLLGTLEREATRPHVLGAEGVTAAANSSCQFPVWWPCCPKVVSRVAAPSPETADSAQQPPVVSPLHRLCPAGKADLSGRTPQERRQRLR